MVPRYRTRWLCDPAHANLEALANTIGHLVTLTSCSLTTTEYDNIDQRSGLLLRTGGHSAFIHLGHERPQVSV